MRLRARTDVPGGGWPRRDLTGMQPTGCLGRDGQGELSRSDVVAIWTVSGPWARGRIAVLDGNMQQRPGRADI
jgi:hypothetical protein